MELPPQFFDESFDPVEHLLLNLPGLQEELLEREQQTTRSVLGAINSRLSARVMRSYGAFVHGMAQVQQLESDLIITAILCRSARRHLSRVQGGMVEGGLHVLCRLRRLRGLAQIRRLAGALQGLGAGCARVGAKLEQPSSSMRLAEVAKELAECDLLLGQIPKLKHCRRFATQARATPGRRDHPHARPSRRTARFLAIRVSAPAARAQLDRSSERLHAAMFKLFRAVRCEPSPRWVPRPRQLLRDRTSHPSQRASQSPRRRAPTSTWRASVLQSTASARSLSSARTMSSATCTTTSWRRLRTRQRWP